MDPKKQIRQLLDEREIELLTEGHGAFEALFDLFEEHQLESGWDPALVDLTTERLLLLNTDQQDEEVTIVPPEVWARLLGDLAKTNYPLAVERMNKIKLSHRDYQSLPMLVDAVNTARAREFRGWPENTTWQERIEIEQMNLVTGEEGLDPWNAIDPEGHSRTRRWTTDFAPEWMDGLEREFGDSASFKTVYYGDGGNFGPAFDESLRDEQGLWRSVRQFNAVRQRGGREPECPWRDADEDEGPNVTLESTYGGEAPGRRCALCDVDLGEEHGVVYLGELGGAVFLLDVAHSVTDVELVEEAQLGGRWEVVAFNGEEEVELPFRPGRLRTQAEAEAFVAEHQGTNPGDLSPTVRVHVVPEEEEPD